MQLLNILKVILAEKINSKKNFQSSCSRLWIKFQFLSLF